LFSEGEKFTNGIVVGRWVGKDVVCDMCYNVMAVIVLMMVVMGMGRCGNGHGNVLFHVKQIMFMVSVSFVLYETNIG
jgi:hypothetical protein